MGEYKDLLDEIKSSTMETFKEIDFKKFMTNDDYVDWIIKQDKEKLEEEIKRISQKRTCNVKLTLLEEHNATFKEKGIDLSFSASDSVLLNNLKNWLKYRIIGTLRTCYFLEGYDCDVCYKEIVSELHIPWENKVIDNIFSVATLFFDFLRMFLLDHRTDIMLGINSKEVKVNKRNVLPFFYKEVFGRIAEEYRDAWIYMNIDKFYKIASEEEKNVFDAFNGLCKYTHTFGNYMPCPNGEYNKKKGFKYKDNIFLLRKSTNEYDEWFEKNESQYHLKCLWDNSSMTVPCTYIYDDLSNYLENCSEIIRKRSEDIFDKEIKKRI